MRAVRSKDRRNDQGKAQGCFERPSPPSLGEVCAVLLPAARLLLCTRCPARCLRGREADFPSLSAGKLLLVFLIPKQPRHKPPPGCSWPGRASSVHVGELLEDFREREGISLALFSLLRTHDGAGTSLFPHLSPCSAGFGDTTGPDRQQTSQPKGGRGAPEHREVPELSKGSPRRCRKRCW